MVSAGALLDVSWVKCLRLAHRLDRDFTGTTLGPGAGGCGLMGSHSPDLMVSAEPQLSLRLVPVPERPTMGHPRGWHELASIAPSGGSVLRSPVQHAILER